ncbi:MAG: tRNA (guanosine(46)-N7)-methyltransferase TrmB [Acaryochloridaceae cyanobacterium SU_2_1]|nr:tRNA (guanosine(46)-N7)-methyltransferase TrmB [Acaryochloridaceae cyanobacterium SU_2_1]NJM95571.1 tRNA (guanosine(46)-N7)-methyltransferase TrmB [Acaryochloridaceae cyanobacterium CSU_5_19]
MVVRVRQHVNPLSKKFQTATPTPDWQAIYEVQQPLHLDIGCAKGQFLLEMAQIRPDWNFLGVEIRQPLVEQANWHRDRLGLRNLHYLFGNINVSLPVLLSHHSVQGVTIQFPDPWFKRRQQKRRVVQPQLVDELSRCLQPGGFVFIQSDVKEVAIEMRDRIATHAAFILAPSGQDWLTHNPLPIATERERQTLEQGLPVYRSLFERADI